VATRGAPAMRVPALRRIARNAPDLGVHFVGRYDGCDARGVRFAVASQPAATPHRSDWRLDQLRLRQRRH
jgi:hypothetical protein